MGRVENAQRRASEEGRAAAPARPAHAAPPWTFDDDERPAPPPDAAERASADVPAPADEAPAPQRAAARKAPPAFPTLDGAGSERLVVSALCPPILVEQFRSLAATLTQAQAGQPLKTVLVTSASVGDGKSLVAANLALTLGESYKRRVLLIDADLRRPTLHHLFHVTNGIGLSEGLMANADEKLTVAPISEHLSLLRGGRPTLDPMGGLSSARMKRIVEEAADRFDWVILDAPPVGVLADAALLAGMVDGAILVVRAGVTPFPELEAAVASLGSERILGILLNAVDPADMAGRGLHYHHYYSHDTREAASR